MNKPISVPNSRLIPEPTIFILYGGTGDLAHRLVLPGLYNLAIAGLLPEVLAEQERALGGTPQRIYYMTFPPAAFGVVTIALPLGKWFHTPTLPAYSRLLHDVLIGDRSLFTRPDGLEHVWEVADAILRDKAEPIFYPRGFWGPTEADALVPSRHWRSSD